MRNISKFELANNGDDCVLIIERKNLELFVNGFREYMAEFGFDIVLEEPVYTLECVKFCQTQPIFDGQDYVMVRDPRIALAKDCVSHKAWDGRSSYEKWIGAHGDCGISLTGGIPIFQSFYAGMQRAACGRKPLLNDPTLDLGIFIAAKGMKRCFTRVDPRTRFSFWLAFGIVPDLQILIEQWYDARTPLFRNIIAAEQSYCPVVWLD